MSIDIPEVPFITPAEYHRGDPAPTPSIWLREDIEYCIHDHVKGNCRHKECPHYAPSPFSKESGELTKE